ncbi:MAG: ribonuclease HII [Muribaculaceae bacterium]
MLKPYLYPGIMEAGCDEAGRGCLCGPVSCAAVILPPDFECPQLNDSKQLTEKKREELRPYIEEHALAWAVVMVDAEEIDRINILNASIIGMHRALDALSIRPQHILVDGNRFKPYTSPSNIVQHVNNVNIDNTDITDITDNIDNDTIPDGIIIPHTTVVKGDATYMSIAAASVLAKTHRDELMKKLAAQYPGYDWEINKGYPTKAHRQAIARLGATPLHRHTFRLL